MSARASGVAQEHDIPAEILAAAGMAHDYADLFVAEVDGAGEHPPEAWARAMFEGKPGRPAPGGVLAWQVTLQLRLRPSPERIAGWDVRARGEDWIRLESRSWFMTAHCVFRVTPGRVWFATFVRYDRAIGRAWWGKAVSAGHRRVAPGAMRSAAARLAKREPYSPR